MSAYCIVCISSFVHGSCFYLWFRFRGLPELLWQRKTRVILIEIVCCYFLLCDFSYHLQPIFIILFLMLTVI